MSKQAFEPYLENIVSGINAHYRAILEMSRKGWPGGLRWLFGEERGET